jgi:hypothetical protein
VDVRFYIPEVGDMLDGASMNAMRGDGDATPCDVIVMVMVPYIGAIKYVPSGDTTLSERGIAGILA